MNSDLIYLLLCLTSSALLIVLFDYPIRYIFFTYFFLFPFPTSLPVQTSHLYFVSFSLNFLKNQIKFQAPKKHGKKMREKKIMETNGKKQEKKEEKNKTQVKSHYILFYMPIQFFLFFFLFTSKDTIDREVEMKYLHMKIQQRREQHIEKEWTMGLHWYECKLCRHITN